MKKPTAKDVIRLAADIFRQVNDRDFQTFLAARFLDGTTVEQVVHAAVQKRLEELRDRREDPETASVYVDHGRLEELMEVARKTLEGAGK